MLRLDASAETGLVASMDAIAVFRRLCYRRRPIAAGGCRRRPAPACRGHERERAVVELESGPPCGHPANMRHAWSQPPGMPGQPVSDSVVRGKVVDVDKYSGFVESGQMPQGRAIPVPVSLTTTTTLTTASWTPSRR